MIGGAPTCHCPFLPVIKEDTQYDWQWNAKMLPPVKTKMNEDMRLAFVKLMVFDVEVCSAPTAKIKPLWDDVTQYHR